MLLLTLDDELWAEELLSPERVRGTGILEADPIQRVWKEHLGGADRLQQIWTVLMFLQWSEQWRADTVTA